MAQYTLHIKIDSPILKNNASDNLCIAKKVNDEFTTVFHGASINPVGKQSPLLAVNTFKWTEEYQVFLTQEFTAGVQVSASTNLRNIKFGEVVEFDSSAHDIVEAVGAAEARFTSAATAKNSFIIGHIPQGLHASISCKTGSNEWAPVYVDNKPHNGEQDKLLTPINKYSLFWDSLLVTSAMIDYAKSSSPKEFEFPANEFEMTWRFGYKIPDHPGSANEQATWYKE